MASIRILGTGSYVPPKVLTNLDLQKMGLDTTDDWIVQRTGVKERRMADPDVATSDLGYEASLKALDMAGLEAGDLDLIILATITPDTCCPSGANWLQAKLDAPQAVTFDVTAACSGFIFGLNVAEQYLKAGAAKRILVVAAEVMTRTAQLEGPKDLHPVGRRRRSRCAHQGEIRARNPFHPSAHGRKKRTGSPDAGRGIKDHPHLP